MLTVRQLLKNKAANHIWSLPHSQMVIDALEMMAAKNIGAVLVMRDDALVGIFSERDYARKGILQGRKAKSTPVTEVMTSTVFTVTPEQNIEDCMLLMTAKKIRHLPVMEEGRVIGLLSIGDMVNAVISEQEDRIKSLEQYIVGY